MKIVTFNEEETYKEEGGDVVYITRSGRNVKRPRRLIVKNECIDDFLDDSIQVAKSHKYDEESFSDVSSSTHDPDPLLPIIIESSDEEINETSDDEEESTNDDDQSDLSFIVPDNTCETPIEGDDEISLSDSINLCSDSIFPPLVITIPMTRKAMGTRPVGKIFFAAERRLRENPCLRRCGRRNSDRPGT